jgi:hypothetical protein
MSRRPRAQVAAVGRVEKQLGSLPVIADFSARLDIAGTVDRVCPMRDLFGSISHGQVVEALIANRLTSPKAMVAVADWARSWAMDEVYGIDPDALNDDRLGRALDALAGQVFSAAGASTVFDGVNNTSGSSPSTTRQVTQRDPAMSTVGTAVCQEGANSGQRCGTIAQVALLRGPSAS